MNNEERDENHDDTGIERGTEAGTAPGGIDAVRADESGPSDEEPHRHLDARTNADVEAQDDSEIADRDIPQIVAALMRMGVSESYSGMLPKPEDFNKYPVNVQERMCRWNDAFTIDESKRQDRLVDAEIDQARKGMWISGALFALAMLFGLVCFLATGSQWSFGFLAVPVVSMIVNLFEPIASRSSRDKKTSTKSDEENHNRKQS